MTLLRPSRPCIIHKISVIMITKKLLLLLLAAMPLVGAHAQEGERKVLHVKVKAGDTLKDFDCGDSDSLVVTGELSVLAQYALGRCCQAKSMSYNFAGCKFYDNTLVHYAFYDPETEQGGLVRYVVLPEGLTAIGYGAFMSCRKLRDVRLPESLTRISERAFYQCAELRRVKLPAGVTTIGSEAFSCCIKLADVTLPESLTEISKECFFNCKVLGSIEIPRSVKKIDTRAFSHCLGLQHVTFNEGLEETGMGAFWYSGLTELHLPSSMRIVGEDSFLRTELRELILPEGIREIHRYAFGYNYLLEKLSIPSTVDSIAALAFFYDYEFLKDIYCHLMAPTPHAKWSPFDEYNENPWDELHAECTLYVPIGAKANFESDPFWNMFDHIVEIAEDEFPTQGIATPRSVPTEAEAGERHYTLSGIATSAVGRGLHIVRMKDGSVRKVCRKRRP